MWNDLVNHISIKDVGNSVPEIEKATVLINHNATSFDGVVMTTHSKTISRFSQQGNVV